MSYAIFRRIIHSLIDNLQLILLTEQSFIIYARVPLSTMMTAVWHHYIHVLSASNLLQKRLISIASKNHKLQCFPPSNHPRCIMLNGWWLYHANFHDAPVNSLVCARCHCGRCDCRISLLRFIAWPWAGLRIMELIKRVPDHESNAPLLPVQVLIGFSSRFFDSLPWSRMNPRQVNLVILESILSLTVLARFSMERDQNNFLIVSLIPIPVMRCFGAESILIRLV